MSRESATYAELQDLMGEGDRELMNEDDTQSFEALELRLRTPMRAVAKSRVCMSFVFSTMLNRANSFPISITYICLTIWLQLVLTKIVINKLKKVINIVAQRLNFFLEVLQMLV